MDATTIRETIDRLVKSGQLVKCTGCGKWIAPVAQCDWCEGQKHNPDKGLVALRDEVGRFKDIVVRSRGRQ